MLHRQLTVLYILHILARPEQVSLVDKTQMFSVCKLWSGVRELDTHLFQAAWNARSIYLLLSERVARRWDHQYTCNACFKGLLKNIMGLISTQGVL